MRIYLDIDENQIIRDVEIQDIRMRRSSCNQQYGNRDGKRKDGSGSNGGYK